MLSSYSVLPLVGFYDWHPISVPLILW